MSGEGGAIAVFVKTPGLSPVKRRLAAEIGAERAEAFYRLSVPATVSVVRRFLSRHPQWCARFAVAEAEAAADPAWTDFPARHTGGGDLGTRLWRVSTGLLAVHPQVLLIGADSPQITPADLETAAAGLARHDWVIGPAADGGFWCCGLKRALARAAWRNVPFDRHEDGASQRVRAALTAAAGAEGFGAPGRLRMLHDADHAGDLACIRRQWPRAGDETEAQQRLRRWLDHHLGSPHKPQSRAAARAE